jgi:cysteine-rich repeat protein
MGRLLSRDAGIRMKSRGLFLLLGISFTASAVAIAGCIPEQDAYPNGRSRPPGGGIGPSGSKAICGDNRVDTGESCDDGNQTDGDGCSAMCQVEACWDCSSGECTPLASNTPCNGAQVCDGRGACGDCVPVEIACDKCMNCAGSTCDEASDCASAACVTGVCRSANGSACADPVECASNSCSGGGMLLLCGSCTDASQCKSGSCDSITGQCLAAMGEPCDGSVMCASGLQCSPSNICQGVQGVNCIAHYQCVSNYCSNGACAPCLLGMGCASGVCTSGACPPVSIPDGAYCVNSADCASGNCTDFPRRCAPP